MSFIYKYKISHGFTKGVSGGDVWYLEINDVTHNLPLPTIRFRQNKIAYGVAFLITLL